jgi:NAD(P)-dependent dehydrogenase (short-subunit alcohol dehydrogenase family)
MELRGSVVVVTGGARGIGRALAERFLAEGAAGVAVVDLEAASVEATAAALGEQAIGLAADVSELGALTKAVDAAEAAFGPVTLFCANAGIATGVGLEAPDEVWERTWKVNTFAHVQAARVMVPRWLERGGGHLLVTASAAGLLSQIGDGPYSTTKAAAVGFAEWLSITYGDRGVGVSCLCPQGVRTDMVLGGAGELGAEVVIAQGLIEPTEVADAVATGLADDRFLILPHLEVAEYIVRKATDRDRWLAGMRRLQARITAAGR